VRLFRATLRAARLFGKFSQFCLANIFNITCIKMVKISSKIQVAQFAIYVLAYPYPLFL
jgi:predicted metalloenzyme YecM